MFISLGKEKFIVLFYKVLQESVMYVIGNQTSKAFATVKQYTVWKPLEVFSIYFYLFLPSFN